jgi:aspartate racemase
MKRLGILGGVGPQATSFIFERIIESAQNEHGAVNNSDYPDLRIATIPVPDFISEESNIEPAKQMLIEAAKSLEASGCEALVIASNTVHILLDDLKHEVSTPFISMVELVSERCKELGLKKVALLGTPILLKSGLYDEQLHRRGIELIKPDTAQVRVCDNVIRSVIAGSKDVADRKEYIEVLSSMFERGADAIILGCTELPLVLNYEVLGKRIISSDTILAEGITAFCYE